MTMTDMTLGPGLLPIYLGKARLQKSQHTLTHFYDISIIRMEIQKLNDNYNLLMSQIEPGQDTETTNYVNLIRHTRNTISDKLYNIYPSKLNRRKRGLNISSLK